MTSPSPSPGASSRDEPSTGVGGLSADDFLAELELVDADPEDVSPTEDDVIDPSIFDDLFADLETRDEAESEPGDDTEPEPDEIVHDESTAGHALSDHALSDHALSTGADLGPDPLGDLIHDGDVDADADRDDDPSRDGDRFDPVPNWVPLAFEQPDIDESGQPAAAPEVAPAIGRDEPLTAPQPPPLPPAATKSPVVSSTAVSTSPTAFERGVKPSQTGPSPLRFPEHTEPDQRTPRPETAPLSYRPQPRPRSRLRPFLVAIGIGLIIGLIGAAAVAVLTNDPGDTTTETASEAGDAAAEPTPVESDDDQTVDDGATATETGPTSGEATDGTDADGEEADGSATDSSATDSGATDSGATDGSATGGDAGAAAADVPLTTTRTVHALRFDPGTTDLTVAGATAFDELVAVLEANPDAIATATIRTTSEVTAVANHDLALTQAQALQTAFDTAGVGDRTTVQALGAIPPSPAVPTDNFVVVGTGIGPPELQQLVDSQPAFSIGVDPVSGSLRTESAAPLEAMAEVMRAAPDAAFSLAAYWYGEPTTEANRARAKAAVEAVLDELRNRYEIDSDRLGVFVPGDAPFEIPADVGGLVSVRLSPGPDLAHAVTGLGETLSFEPGSADPVTTSTAALDSIASSMADHDGDLIINAVAFDGVGPSGNLELSRARAEAVVDALTERDVDPERLRPLGSGADSRRPTDAPPVTLSIVPAG